MDSAEPVPRVFPANLSETRAVVLVLHGGRAADTTPARTTQLAYLRMVPFARAVHADVSGEGTAVWLLRNRVRGWNDPAMDPVRDARWALAEIERRHPGAGVVLLGHSMGARAALRIAGSNAVRAVCALAPWAEEQDPVEQLAGRRVGIVHGTDDHVTPASSSAVYARRAELAGTPVERVVLPGAGHAMVRRYRDWTRQVRAFVGSAVAEVVNRPEGRTA
ncbi:MULTISPECIES: alpha/beta hydrolase [unclassified Actinopolyspora]|uniref:alpha/beta hydrolase family protein n=1 Tax=unclassified Actinopolyspora TaxID=2639451 RepID=UPI0013F6238F|nr:MULTISPECIES: alpha/beta hydrolase [unclassified Actinopolyspora]NHD16174.1 lysophospholipase [Actinopolyspora sp. BKK2]NHE74612.1 lysophospholipase [Actinopolyspora sp. BKK1]